MKVTKWKLTRDQLDVLDQTCDRWLRPMDMGGRDGSGHSAILGALVRKGLVERTQRGGHIASARGSYLYRITADGLSARSEAHGSSDPS